MKHKQILMAGAVVATGALSLVGLSAYAAADYTNITTVDDLKACLESTTETDCKLGGDITPEANVLGKIPATITNRVLDLNGHSIKATTSGDSEFKFTINPEGGLTIKDSVGTGKVYGNVQVTGSLVIENGTFYKSIFGTGDGTDTKNITIKNGTFNETVSTGQQGNLVIENGTFNKSVSASGASTIEIKDGKYDGSVSLYTTGKSKISGGQFNDTLYASYENSDVEISGGTFTFMNCAGSDEGSKLTISGGTFTRGFNVNVSKLRITGGKFMNGSEDEGGHMAFVINDDDQDYLITGGQFVNTADEYGYLMAIFTPTKPTEASIRGYFEGGNVLAGKTIKLDTTSTTSPYISYIMKEKTNDDDLEGDVKVPDTGHSTMNGDNMSSTSIAIIVASALAGSLALGAAAYFGLHKKVAFGKK